MTPTDDGGRIAARGLEYQYLRTLEAILDVLSDADIAAIRVEGPSGSERVDAVDFDVLDFAGNVRFAAQVKSAAPGRTVSAATTFGQLVDLVTNHDAAAYAVLTNATAEPSTLQLAAALGTQQDASGLRTVLGTV